MVSHVRYIFILIDSTLLLRGVLLHVPNPTLLEFALQLDLVFFSAHSTQNDFSRADSSSGALRISTTHVRFMADFVASIANDGLEIGEITEVRNSLCTSKGHYPLRVCIIVQ